MTPIFNALAKTPPVIASGSEAISA